MGETEAGSSKEGTQPQEEHAPMIASTDKANVCSGGPLSGYRFPNTTGATKIRYTRYFNRRITASGHYIKTTMRDEADRSIWTWYPQQKQTT